MTHQLDILIRDKFTPEESDRIPIDFAAKLCGLSVRALYNYLSAGKLNIPIVKVGQAHAQLITYNS